jgi:hypothetical protein
MPLPMCNVQDIIVGNSCIDAWLNSGATCGFAKTNGQDIM